MIEIVLLAMIFLFVGLRLWSVLGRRTGHEQPIAKPVETQAPLGSVNRTTSDLPAPAASAADSLVDPAASEGVRAIRAVDATFDPAQFLGGARAAYQMVLEAFWRGDEEELGRLADDDVRSAFAAAIADRNAAGHTLENRLVAIERAVIDKARVEGGMAHVTVLFDADIAAVTRDADGNVVAGSLTDAIDTHDIWTFSRQIRSSDPNWLLTETDEAA